VSRNKELEILIADLRKERSLQKASHEKELAILNQKIQLYDSQMAELKAQQADSEKAQVTLLNVMKNLEAEQESSKDNVTEIIKQQRNQQLEEIRKLEEEYRKTKLRLVEQVENLTNENSEIELKLKVTQSELNNEIDHLTKQNEDLELQLGQSLNQNKDQETQREQLIKTLEDKYQRKISELEKDISNLEASNKHAIETLANQKNQDLSQLKHFYEIEKDRLESRILEERESHKRKIDAIIEEHQDQLREEQEQHDEEVEELQEAIRGNKL